MIKKSFLLGLIFSFFYNTGLAIDSLSRAIAFVGPPVLVIPPPVDSAVLRKTLVGERLKKRVSEQAELESRQNSLQLRSLLRQTETSGTPEASMLDFLEISLGEYLRAGDSKGESLIYTTYGVYYGRFGQPDKAIYYFTEALKIKEKLKDNAGIARLAENLSLIYKMEGQYDKAINYAEYVVAANQAMKKTAVVANTYLDIALMKYKQEKFKESETYILRKAFPLFQRTGNKVGRMKSFQSLADLYFRQHRLSEAKWFYLQSEIMATKLLDIEARINSLTGLANVKSALGESAEALRDYREAEHLALQNNYLVNLVEIHANLGEMYSRMGDYPAAGDALDSYSRFRESWINTNKL